MISQRGVNSTPFKLISIFFFWSFSKNFIIKSFTKRQKKSIDINLGGIKINCLSQNTHVTMSSIFLERGSLVTSNNRQFQGKRITVTIPFCFYSTEKKMAPIGSVGYTALAILVSITTVAIPFCTYTV